MTSSIIPVAAPLRKGYVGDPLIELEVVEVTGVSAITLTDNDHWGRLVSASSGCSVGTSLSDAFWCLFRNTGSASSSINSSDALTIEGSTTIEPNEVVWIIKTATQAIAVPLNMTATTAQDRTPFPPASFVSTTASVTTDVSDVGDVYIFTEQGDLNLPASSTLTVGDYIGVVNEVSTADAAVFVVPASGDTIAGETGSDVLLPGVAAIYVYRGGATWQKLLNANEQVVPPWAVSTNQGVASDLTITPPTWASTYQNTVITGEGQITLPNITAAAVAVGTGIRVVATGASGFGINVQNSASQTIEGQPDPATVSPDLSIPQGEEAILIKRSALGTEWDLFYFGAARAVGAGASTRIAAGVNSWAGLADAINQNEIQTTLDGYGYVRGENNLPDDDRAILDNIQVERGTVPTNAIVTLFARRGGPRTSFSDYTLSSIPTTAGTYSILVQRPLEVSEVVSDGTGADITVTRINSSFEDWNAYTVVINDAGTGATTITVNGGQAPVTTLAMSDLFSLSGGDLHANSITRQELNDDVVNSLISVAEKEDLQLLNRDIITVTDASTSDGRANVDGRVALFFNEPTSDDVFPTNEAPNTNDVTFANQSGAGTLFASLASRTGGVLTSPGVVGGGFDVVSASGALDMRDAGGILIAGTVEDTVVRAQQDEVIFDLDNGAFGIVIDTNGRFAARVQRANTTEETDNNTRTTTLTTNGNQESAIGTSGANLTAEYEVGALLTGAATVLVELEIFRNGTHWGAIGPLTYSISDITMSQSEQSFQNTIIISNSLASRTITTRVSYNPSQTNSGEGTRRVITVVVDNWNASEISFRIKRVRLTQTLSESIPNGTTDFELPEEFAIAQRYTFACQIMRNPSNGELDFRFAVNGQFASTVLFENISRVQVTGSTFQNPTIRFGGSARNFPGALTRVYVGKVDGNFVLFNNDIIRYSGNFGLPFYGLITPANSEREIVTQGVRWQVAINNDETLPGTPAVEEFDLSLEDDFGRPGLPAISSADITNGRYTFRVLVYETISTNVHVVNLAWHELGLVNGSAAYRTRFVSSIVDPTGNELIVSPNNLRLNHTALSSNALFSGNTITAALQIVLR